MIENYMYFAISPTAWIMKISTLFMALSRLVVTLNIKPIYISKTSNKNVFKKYSVAVILIISWSSPAASRLCHKPILRS